MQNSILNLRRARHVLLLLCLVASRAGADYDVNKIITQCRSVEAGQVDASYAGPAVDIRQCRAMLDSLSTRARQAKDVAKLYPGSGKDLVLSNFRAEVKRSSNGAPLTVVLHYDLESPIGVNAMGLAPRQLSKVVERDAGIEARRGFDLIDGEISPPPERLQEQMPRILSQLGFKAGQRYHAAVEFSPWFIFGYRAPLGRPCFDPRAKESAEPLRSAEQLRLDMRSVFHFEVDRELGRQNGPSIVAGDLGILPLADFFSGHRTAGTPVCVATSGGGSALP